MIQGTRILHWVVPIQRSPESKSRYEETSKKRRNIQLRKTAEKRDLSWWKMRSELTRTMENIAKETRAKETIAKENWDEEI